jgi:PhzF family phenazine biosynthesis protein
MSFLIFQVDAFTGEVFRGNPAGVCVYAGEKEAQWMQNVAAEMNLAETAFVSPRADGGFELRWFTPECEVDLCGHATLATAHVLWETGLLPAGGQGQFYSRSGLLTADRLDGWIRLDFPAVTAEPASQTKTHERALGATPVEFLKHAFGTLSLLESADVVRNLDPGLPALARTAGDIHIVTARGDSDEFDFVSRVFCPRIGIPEDPVTGAAHCCLGPFWKQRLGKDRFTAWQASKRGGTVVVEVRGGRVALEGQAVTVFRGEFV